jgi:hypothetical protein
MINRKREKKCFWGAECSRCVRLTTSPPFVSVTNIQTITHFIFRTYQAVVEVNSMSMDGNTGIWGSIQSHIKDEE